MDRTQTFGLTMAALALLGAGCGKSKKSIIVGSKNFTEQVVLGEIMAQHLEHRLGRKWLPGGSTSAARCSVIRH